MLRFAIKLKPHKTPYAGLSPILQSYTLYNNHHARILISKFSTDSSGKYAISNDTTFSKLFDSQVDFYEHKDALRLFEPNERHTFLELRKLINGRALGFIELEHRKGCRVAVWMDNNKEYAILQYAMAKSGITLVAIDPSATPGHVEQILNLVTPRCIVVGHNRIKDLQVMVPELEKIGYVNSGLPLRSRKFQFLKNCMSYSHDRHPGIYRIWEVDLPNPYFHPHPNPLDDIRIKELTPKDKTLIQFTIDPVTGQYKGFTFNFDSLLYAAKQVNDAMNLTYKDSVLITLPLYNYTSYVFGSLNCLISGSEFVFPFRGPLPSTPDKILHALSREDCTVFIADDETVNLVLNSPKLKNYDLSHLRSIMIVNPKSNQIVERVKNELKIKEVHTSLVGINGPLFSINGNILPETQIKVIDTNNKMLQKGSGELVVQGNHVYSEYFNCPTVQSDINGWIRTGVKGTFNGQNLSLS